MIKACRFGPRSEATTSRAQLDDRDTDEIEAAGLSTRDDIAFYACFQWNLESRNLQQCSNKHSLLFRCSNRSGQCKAHIYLRYRSQTRRLAIMTATHIHNHPQEEGASLNTRICVTERLGRQVSKTLKPPQNHETGQPPFQSKIPTVLCDSRWMFETLTFEFYVDLKTIT